MKVKRKSKLLLELLAVGMIAGFLIGIFSYFSKSAEAAWYSDNWHFRKKLTIDYTKVSGGSDLSNFPVLVSLTDPSLRKAQSDGDDILFTSSDGSTKLNHEIESFTQSNGVLVAWVQVTTLSASANTDIYMYYGNSSAASQQSATSVWDANYVGVWHLKEDPSGGAPQMADSTNNNNGTSSGTMTSSDQVLGKVDGSLDFDGSNDYLDVDTGSGTSIDNLQAWTYEAWIKPSLTNNLYPFMGKGGSRIKYFAILNTGTLRFRTTNTDGSAGLTVTTNTLSANSWAHVVATCDPVNNNPDCKIYINGTEASYSSTSNQTSVGTDDTGYFRIALDGGGAFSVFPGGIDEARVSNVVRTAGWITTEYNNQNDPGSFFSARGTEEVKKNPVLSWHFDDSQGTTAQDSSPNNLDGTLNNTPTWQTEDMCISGKCLYFDGTNNENVSKADDTLLDFGTGSFSIGTWVKRNGASSANPNVILTKSTANIGTTYTGYKLYMDASGDLCFDTQDGTNAVDTACTSAVDFDDNQWHYVSGVKSGTTSLTLYVDGKSRATDSSIASTATLSNASTFYVGVDSDGTTTEWLGFIDEVKVYDFALSANEVKANFASRGSVKGVSANLGSPSASSGQPAWLSNGLVGYWKMDEASWDGTTGEVKESSGNGQNGTSACTGTCSVPTTAFAKFARGADLDGTDDRLNMGSNSIYNFTSSNFTLSGYSYIAQAADINNFDGLINRGDANSDGYYIEFRKSGSTSTLQFITTQSGAAQTVRGTYGDVPIGSWFHWAVVRDGPVGHIYINGAEVSYGQQDSLINPATSSNSFIIGDYAPGISRHPKMKVDEVRVYNRALTPSEVEGLYQWAPGPVAYWKMNETSGNRVDSSGNSNTLTDNNTVTSNPGKLGNAGQFTLANSEYLSMSSNSSVAFGDTNFTISTWVYLDSKATNQMLVAKIGAEPLVDYQLYYHTSSDRWYWDVYGPVWDEELGWTVNSIGQVVANNAGSPSTGTWYHIVAWYDTDTNQVGIQVNNGTPDTAALTGSAAATSSEFDLGRRAQDGLYLNGRLDEVQLYNRLLSAKEKNDLYNFSPAPVAHWKFDEGYLTTANDSTLNNNDLTLSSASWTNSGKFGKAWNGDGTLWVSRTNDADLDFNATDDFAISGWFKSDSATNPSNGIEYIVSTTTGNTDAGYSIYANTDGTICFGIDDDTTWGPDVSSCTTADYYDGNWHHFTAVRNVTLDKTYIYIDAKELDSDTDTTTATLDGDNVFYIGDFDGDNNATAGTEEFAGDIDELKVYRYALTADEVKLDYNRGSSLVLGALSDKSGNQPLAASNEYCVPGDTTSCAGPVGEWKMDEKTGSTVYDTSGNGNNGSPSGSVWIWGSGKFGAGLNQVTNNGTGQNMIVTDPVSGILDFSNVQDYTTQIWFKGTSAEANTIPLYKGGFSAGTAGYDLQVTTGGIAICEYSDGDGSGIESATGTTNLFDNNWHLVSCVMDRDGSQVGTAGLHLFVENKLEASDASLTEGSAASSTSNLALGEPSGTREFNGTIDQARIFNYARTPAQIAWDYNKGAPIAHWKFDECQGTTANDSSGNSNSGTISIGGTGDYTSAGTCTSGTATESWYAGVTGKRNSSLAFDGSDDNVYRADDADLDFSATSDFTVSAWVKHDGTIATNPDYILTKADGTTGGYKLYMDPTGDLCFETDDDASWDTDDSACTSGVDFDDSNWHLITGIKTGTTKIELFVDGVLRASDATIVDDQTLANTGSFYVGVDSDGTSNEWDGQIDDIKVFNYALTSTQVKNLYNNGAVNYGPSSGNP